MKISFLTELCQYIPVGKSITKDMSILFESTTAIDAFSLHPYHWSFELTTKELSETKYLIRYAMGDMCFVDCNHTDLTIPQSQKGEIYIIFSEPVCADGIYYNKYVPFVEKKYYDQKKQIFAIGNININGICVEFAMNQFAVFDKLGDLSAIYVKLN